MAYVHSNEGTPVPALRTVMLSPPSCKLWLVVMSSAPISPAPSEEPSLSRNEWWELFDRLRLSQQADYAEYGGPVAFFRKERDSDADLP